MNWRIRRGIYKVIHRLGFHPFDEVETNDRNDEVGGYCIWCSKWIKLADKHLSDE